MECLYEYRAFGEELKKLGDGDAKYTYGGKELDDETNLYYFNARYYDATIGRFINVDPIQDGTNWYVYCNNNPLSFVDPTGLSDIFNTEWGIKQKSSFKFKNHINFIDAFNLRGIKAPEPTSIVNEVVKLAMKKIIAKVPGSQYAQDVMQIFTTVNKNKTAISKAETERFIYQLAAKANDAGFQFQLNLTNKDGDCYVSEKPLTYRTNNGVPEAIVDEKFHYKSNSYSLSATLLDKDGNSLVEFTNITQDSKTSKNIYDSYFKAANDATVKGIKEKTTKKYYKEVRKE